jgi:hypothetical protein
MRRIVWHLDTIAATLAVYLGERAMRRKYQREGR